MLLHEAIAAAGLTPPPADRLVPNRWIRFPGCGKGRSNRAGWLRIISPTLAIFGDWSTDLRVTWRSDDHRDDERSAQLLEEARRREREFAREQVKRARAAEVEAARMLDEAKEDTHPYLIAKGFKHSLGLVRGSELLVPMYSIEDYRLVNLQRIAADGTKRFLAGARAKGAIHVLGPVKHDRQVLCEGFATGLTLRKAFELLPGYTAVVVCFSAGNLVAVAPEFRNAIVAADHDESGAGEAAARKTGLRWVMPQESGTDFNDLHGGTLLGLHKVEQILREAIYMT